MDYMDNQKAEPSLGEFWFVDILFGTFFRRHVGFAMERPTERTGSVINAPFLNDIFERQVTTSFTVVGKMT